MRLLFENWNQWLEEDLGSFDKPSLELKEELNPELWEEDERMNPEITERLLLIARDFWNKLELQDVRIVDIVLTGSLANYNWSKYSDIDLHIRVDFSDVDENGELVKQFFDAKRKLWNQLHEITIKGYEVEIYIENLGEAHESTGIYSIMKDDWLTKPTKQDVKIDWRSIELKFEEVTEKADRIESDYKSGKLQKALGAAEKLKEKIMKFRKCGLERGGQYSVENLVFKVLRRTDYIKKLIDVKNMAYDELMSINGS